MITNEQLGYKAFIQHCLDNDEIESICSLKDYKIMQEQLKNDGFLGQGEGGSK